MMASSKAAEKSPGGKPGLKIINASLYRMGTKSMATAYGILGFKTHHGLLEDPLLGPYSQLEEAAEGKWPDVPRARRRQRERGPFTRADWDGAFGQYEAVTDLASPFAADLAREYPEAKVVVVQRDFDSWWPSMKSRVIDQVFDEPRATVIAVLCRVLLGYRGLYAMQKTLLGLFGARDHQSCLAHGRDGYDRYFNEIRDTVPPERRLEYKLGDGWEPLCKFLGVDVPDVKFPRENDRAAHQEVSKNNARRVYVIFALNGLPWIVAFVALAFGIKHVAARL